MPRHVTAPIGSIDEWIALVASEAERAPKPQRTARVAQVRSRLRTVRELARELGPSETARIVLAELRK